MVRDPVPAWAMLAFFAALLGLDVIGAGRRRSQLYGLRDTVTNAALGSVNRLLGLVWAPVEIALFVWLHDHAPLDLGTHWTVYVGAVIAVDLLFYAYHRLHHEVPVLWAVHEMHHSSELFNMSTALRQPWLIVTLTPFVAVLALAGFPPQTLVVAYLVNVVYTFPLHTRLVPRLPGRLERIFNSPSNHRVHHGRNRLYVNKNFGGVFVVWDVLFGTYEREDESVEFGIANPVDSFNPGRIFTHGFRDLRDEVRRSSDKISTLRSLFRRRDRRPVPATR